MTLIALNNLSKKKAENQLLQIFMSEKEEQIKPKKTTWKNNKYESGN